MATEQPALPDPQVQQVVHGDHNIVVGAGNVTINNLRSHESSRERRSLEILLERVEQFWIKGVLQGSVHDEVLLELGKEALPGVVEHPWEKILEVPGQAGRTLPFEHEIGEVFEEVGRFLLVLGEPGAGKTTTLLELARGLLARARSDIRQPIPVVFNLSTWATGRKPLADWLADELKSKYFVSRLLAKTWLASSLLLPLLDGLDEVKDDSQSACVEAVNAFVQGDGAPGLVVCSRSAEYLRLPVRLKLNGAVRLLPLNPEQIAGYFHAAGPRLSALAAALSGDPGLRELAHSPLMLSVMTLAYQDVPLAAMADRQRTAADVFSTYIDRMFERKGKGAQPYSKEATVTWLSRLARGLQAGNQTVFLIEQLQPAWLRTRAQLWAYALSSRLLVGTVAGFVAALISRWQPILLFFGVLQGIGAGLLDGWRFMRWRRRGSTAQPRWFFAHLAAAISIAGLCSLLPDWTGADVFSVWLFNPFCGFLFGLQARSDTQDIRTVERLAWSWRRALKIGSCCLMAYIVFFYIFLNVESIIGVGFMMRFASLLFYSLCLPVVPFGALYGGLAFGILETKSRPNQGIVLSVRNAGLACLGVGMSLGTFFFVISGFSGDLQGFVQEGLFGSLLTFFGSGGMDVFRHVSLRLVLWRSGDAPLAYPRFLDHAAKLIFLQKVGGGYIFMHRLLLEHFASLENQAEIH